MATVEELRDIIHRPLTEVSQAMAMAMSMFNKQQADADKEVGREMSNLSKRYISVLQALTGIKDGWVASPTSHLLSLDNEDAGITIDIHWEVDLGTGKADVTVELNKRSGPERPGAKWQSKIVVVKGVVPNQMGLSPVTIMADQVVRRFLKENVEELLTHLIEEDGWTELTEAAMDRKKLERAIYKKMPIGNKGTYKTVGSRTVKAPAKSGGQPTIMFTGDLASKMGRQDYDSAALSSLSDDELRKIAGILGITEDVDDDVGVELNEVEGLRAIIEGKPRGPVKGGGQGYWSREEKKGELKKKERRSKGKEIQQQLRGEEMEGFVDEGHGVVFLSTAIDATITEAETEGMSSAERFQGNLLDLSAYKDKRFLSPRKMMMFGKLVSKRMANTFDPIYVADPMGMLKDAAIMAPFRAEMDRTLGMGTWNIDKVKSPKTGKSGWRITYSKGGSEIVPGGDMRTAQVAFDKLKRALRNFELPTEGGSRRKADPGEFMLMNMAQGGSKAMFKHRDTRNYIIIDMKSGKMEVPITSKPFFRGYFDVFEEVEEELAEGVAKHEVKRAEAEWKDAEAAASSMEKWKDEGWREARVEADKLKKSYEALAAKWEKQSKKSREYSRGRADAMRSVGMVRTRSGQWEDEASIEGLRAIIERKGTPYEKRHGHETEASFEKGERKGLKPAIKAGKTYMNPWQQPSKSHPYEKKAHARSIRRSEKKEIEARMRGEDVSLDDLGHYVELVAEELQEAMAASSEPVEPVLPMQMTNLKVIQSTADQLSRFTREFADYLKKAMAAKQVDVDRLGRFGRQVDAAHRIFKDTYRKLALGYSEDMGWDDEANAIEEELDAIEEAMAIGRGAAYEVPSPVPFAKKATLAGRKHWRKQLRKHNIPMGAQEMMMELAQIMSSLPMSDRKLVDQMMNMTWYGPEDLGGPEMNSYVDAIKKLHKRIFGKIKGTPTR